MLPVGVRVTAFEPAEIDLLLGCKLHGGTVAPIGFRLTASVQGLTLSYTLLPAEEAAAHVSAPRAEPHVPPPEAYAPPPRLEFGDDTPIFEQRTLLLLVRNHSAVPTSYAIGAAKYHAGELPADLAEPPTIESFSLSAAMLAAMKAAEIAAKRAAAARERAPARPTKRRHSRKQSAANTTTLSHGALRRSAAGTGGVPARRGSLAGTMSMSSTTARSMSLCGGGVGDNIDAPCRPILGDAHEHSQPFFSANGVNFSAQRLLQQREAALLASGAGACIELTPSSGDLPPWGEALIAVRTPTHAPPIPHPPPPLLHHHSYPLRTAARPRPLALDPHTSPVHVAHLSRPRGTPLPSLWQVRTHSNLWGLYEDELTCHVDGLPAITLPVRLGVVGARQFMISFIM